MNYIYLMKDEKKNHALFKAGFAKDIATRVYAYTSHNPEVQCISTIRTMDKSKRNIEAIFHEEIKARGYEFVTAQIDGKTTEWFKVSYDDPFYAELEEKGLTAFKCGKRRKNYGVYNLMK
jgi:hypothetical protein